jgi:hypothetical protein
MREKASRRYSRYTYRARKKGIPFSLDLREFALITSMPCYFCGSYDTIGVDRMDNSGYHIHTTCPCCQDCNALKRDEDMALGFRLTTGGRRAKFFRRRGHDGLLR